MPDTTALRPPQRFAQALKRHGVEYLFGQSNPPGLTLAANDLGIEQIGYRTENAGTYMADGYARVTGKVPVVTAQNGPAATLLVPGLAECLSASTPIVALVQDIGPNALDRNAFQELDQLELFKGVSKWTRRVTTADRIEDYVDMAFTLAASGRPGPVVLLVSMELLAQPEAKEPTSPYTAPRTAALGTYPLDRTRPADSAIAEAARLLASAKTPIVYAGGGGYRLGRSGRALPVAAACAPSRRHQHHGQGLGRRNASALDGHHRLLHGHARHGQVPQADGHRGRRHPADRQPHQPERHRLLETFAQHRQVYPHRYRPARDRPQL